MDFNESLRWLYSFKKLGSKLELDRISYLMDRLGNPHNNLKIIHATGTNGKGSVCKFIGSILSKAGYKVGVYISPHLQTFSERITIDDQEISKKDITLLIEKVKPFIEEMTIENRTPTFFEVVTAMAFQFFYDCKVDFAVIEVGLGGRFDATNVVNPIISIITNISLEHTNYLGKNIRSVAYEKAGIIKKNIPIVTAAKNLALEEIKKIAKEKNSPIILIKNEGWKRISYNKEYQEFSIHGELRDYIVRTTQLGMFQGENIALAIKTIEQLQMKGIYISDENIIDGIFVAFNPGRMEIISENPIILLDGAHNPVGMDMLKNTLEKDFVYEKLILILGVLKDKDFKKMISYIAPISDIIIATKSNNIRASNPRMLREAIEKSGYEKEVLTIDSISEAIEHAKLKAAKDDIICISGSLFTVGEAREYLVGIKKEILEY